MTKTMGDRLRDIRKDRDQTLLEVAVAVGIDRTLLGRFETGEKDLGLRAFLALADYYGASLDHIYRGTPSTGLSVAPQGEHPSRKIALLTMWEDLEEPEQDLTFDIVEAAVKSSLRRRYRRA